MLWPLSRSVHVPQGHEKTVCSSSSSWRRKVPMVLRQLFDHRKRLTACNQSARKLFESHLSSESHFAILNRQRRWQLGSQGMSRVVGRCRPTARRVLESIGEVQRVPSSMLGHGRPSTSKMVMNFSIQTYSNDSMPSGQERCIFKNSQMKQC